MPSFKLLRSEVLLKGRAFGVRRDVLLTPAGREAGYDIIEHTGSVVMVPIDELGNVLFVRQYRHAAGTDLLELPAGTLDDNETHESCAAREMREETGMAAGQLEKMGEFFLVPGYSTERMAVFVATELRPDRLPGDADEFLELERIPVLDALRMAASGEILDAKTIAALFLSRRVLIRDPHIAPERMT